MIDIWKIAGDIARLQQYKLVDGEVVVILDDVLAVLNKHILKEKEEEKKNGNTKHL